MLKLLAVAAVLAVAFIGSELIGSALQDRAVALQAAREAAGPSVAAAGLR